jgi:hypothetical protein
MNSSQRTGLLIFAGVTVYMALLFIAGVTAGIWSVVLQPNLNTIGRLCVMVGVTSVAVAYCVRGFRRGDSHLRWLLCFTLVVFGLGLIVVGRLAAEPLSDPVKQAQFEQTDWWIVPVSYAVGAASLLAASLLLLPQVGEYFRHRGGGDRPSTTAPGQGPS